MVLYEPPKIPAAYWAFPFLRAAFLDLNFSTSMATALSTRALSSGRYPSMNRSSSQTKRGAKKIAWNRLSRRAGARPSNLPCPTNWSSQDTMCRPIAHWFVCVGLANLRWLPYEVDAKQRAANAVPATGSSRTYRPPQSSAKKVPRSAVTGSHDGVLNNGPELVACLVRSLV